MRLKVVFVMCMLIAVQFSAAQIEIIMDNDQPDCIIKGTWITKTHVDCYNGTARYIKRGKGDNYLQWNRDLTFPGRYQLEAYLINYKYAMDAHVYLKTQQGDSLIIVDEYYEPKGWKRLGDFDLPRDFSLKITDLFESDSGSYVYADAFKLTYLGQLFKIGGSVTPSLLDTSTIIQVTLFTGDTSIALNHFQLAPHHRQFMLENIPAGIYTLRFAAWGYDTLWVGNLDLRSGDLLDLNFTLMPTQVSRYSLSGKIWLDDSSATARCLVELIPVQHQTPIGYFYVGHNQNYTFINIPTGNYRLRVTGKGYLPDSTTYANIQLNQDRNLGTLRMYAFFQFAWYTDIHIGAGTETGFQTVINNINARKEDLDFAFATGDLTEKGFTTEFNTYKAYTNSLKIPVYNIPGNHDTKWSESGLEGFKTIIGPLYFSFNHKGFHFIGFNSGNYLKGGYGYFDPAHITWLEEDLQSLPDPNMPIIFATHYPLDIDGVPNYWRVLDLLKQYHTVFILVGHGHSNRTYDFEGIPGAMSMDTYQTSSPSGFNIVTVSKKEITLTTVLNSTGTGTTWLRQPYQEATQPVIRFTNLAAGSILTTPKTVDIYVTASMVNGSFSISPEKTSGLLTGSGANWNVTLDPNGLSNGNHTLTVTFTESSGKRYTKTIQFYIENGRYPKAKWRYNAQATIIGSPIFDSSGVYFGASNGKIYGLSLIDGTPLWEPFQSNGMVFSTGCIVDTILFIGTSNNKLYGISTRSGKECWSFTTSGAVIAPVIAQDSLLYFAGNNRLYAINLRTRQKVWEYNTGGLIESRPTIQDEKIIFTSWDRYVHCLNRLSGSVIWRFNRQSSFYYAPAACWPVVSQDKVFIVDPARYLTAINLFTGASIWESNVPECWESIGIAADKSRVYVRSLDGKLYAFATAPNNKQQLWVTNADYGWDSTPSMPIEKNGALFTGGKKGFVIAVQAHDGQIKGKYWAAQELVGTVTPLDADNVLACALDGTISLITYDPALEVSQPVIANLPQENKLLPPYPNPFNSSTQIAFSLKESQPVQMAIYDLLGRQVYHHNFRTLNAGQYTFSWDGKNLSGELLPSGIYFVRLMSPNFNEIRRLLLMK